MRTLVLVLMVATAVLVVPALTGCGGSATDANEPNDELTAATVLTPGTPVDGVLGSDDADVFQCDVPGVDTAGEGATQAGEPRPFVVTVKTDSPGDIELEVGASLPDCWEGITWPGWEAVAKDDRLEVTAALAKGTVIVVLTGDSGSEYSIEIVWD